MTQVMTPEAVAARFAELALGRITSEAVTENGTTTIRGKLPSGNVIGERPASIRVKVTDDGLLNATLFVPGSGNLTVWFMLFADEATEASIERYLFTFMGRHEEAVRELATAIENGDYA